MAALASALRAFSRVVDELAPPPCSVSAPGPFAELTSSLRPGSGHELETTTTTCARFNAPPSSSVRPASTCCAWRNPTPLVRSVYDSHLRIPVAISTDSLDFVRRRPSRWPRDIVSQTTALRVRRCCSCPFGRHASLAANGFPGRKTHYIPRTQKTSETMATSERILIPLPTTACATGKNLYIAQDQDASHEPRTGFPTKLITLSPIAEA